jgi:hypothetical protein
MMIPEMAQESVNAVMAGSIALFGRSVKAQPTKSPDIR